MKKRGFTLVELLAVIVILAIVLVIAVPQIMKTIEGARKGTFESNAKLIAGMAEKKALENETLGITDTVTCEQVAKLNTTDYDSCTIKVENGEAKVSMVGKGKFEGMHICGGTKTNAVVSEEECPLTASTFATKVGTTGGPTRTDDGNIRYVGANADVNNYVTFGNDTDLWRIIGVFTVKNADTNTNEKLIKIVRDEILVSKAWSEGVEGVNDGWGVNQWGSSTYSNGSAYAGATLMTYLNTEASGAYTNAGINSTYAGMIQNVEWNTAGYAYSSYTPKQAYDLERGTRTGKICTGGSACNDTVTRTTRWTGKIGLIYPSDYGFAGGSTCTYIIYTTCGTSNWLNTGGYYWTLSPRAYSGNDNIVWTVDGSGRAYYDSAHSARAVLPALYLKSDVELTGLGTRTSPYTLSR